MPTFYFTPTSFRQANLDGFANIVAAILPAIPRDSIVCELYGGMGLIGLSLVHRCRELRCSDENPNSVRAFEKARRSLPSDLAERAFFTPLAAKEAVQEGEAAGADVLVVDPPRKGLDPEVLALLCAPDDERAASVRTLVYVSCGFGGWERGGARRPLSSDCVDCV